MDGISRSRGWDKEIPHGVLPKEQLVLSDKWARKEYPNLRVHHSSGKPGLPSFPFDSVPEDWDFPVPM